MSFSKFSKIKGYSKPSICQLNNFEVIHLFDTFEGLPEVTKKDNYHKIGDFKDVCEENVKQLLQQENNWRIFQGIFPNDTGKFIANNQFRLVHLDVDTYTSYRDSLRFFYPRMTIGGVIVMDDYGLQYCLGAKKAVDEFIKDKSERLVIGPERQAHFFKM